MFVTLAEEGMLAAAPGGELAYATSLPVRGEIDIVGAGDSVTANLAAALAAGAVLGEAVELANAAASVVIHQLGTTGTASVRQIAEVLGLRGAGTVVFLSGGPLLACGFASAADGRHDPRWPTRPLPSKRSGSTGLPSWRLNSRRNVSASIVGR